jgi:hypothetical protein
MRPVAIGRRNWTHIGHEKAGPRVAAILSIVEGSPTYPSRDFQNSLPPHGPLAICNCQCGFA